MCCWRNSFTYFLFLLVVITTVLSIDITYDTSTIRNDGRIIKYEMYLNEQVRYEIKKYFSIESFFYFRKFINETVNQTYHEKLYRQDKCPDDEKKLCQIPYFEKRTRSYSREVKKMVPVYSCLAGFELRNEICYPICANNCKNSFCSAPEHCECFTDYAVDKDEYVSTAKMITKILI